MPELGLRCALRDVDGAGPPRLLRLCCRVKCWAAAWVPTRPPRPRPPAAFGTRGRLRREPRNLSGLWSRLSSQRVSDFGIRRRHLPDPSSSRCCKGKYEGELLLLPPPPPQPQQQLSQEEKSEGAAARRGARGGCSRARTGLSRGCEGRRGLAGARGAPTTPSTHSGMGRAVST